MDIDGKSFPEEQPSSLADLQDLVRVNYASRHALYPFAGGTLLNYGGMPSKAGVAVNTSNLNKIVDYPARDMTITVQTGISIENLQKTLASENQHLPIDVPKAEQATLGGILAANVMGSRRYGYGTLRDYLIGIEMVNNQGHAVKGGGRVVKNVAGYDLCKMVIGSLGTLGILTQATLKVLPRPELNALMTVHCSIDQLMKLLDDLHRTRTLPVCIDLLNGLAAKHCEGESQAQLPQNDWLVLIGYESNSDAVNWQVQQLLRELKTDYQLEAKIGPTAESLWTALREMPARINTQLSLRIGLLPSQCAEFCRTLTERFPYFAIQAHAGNGQVRAYCMDEIDAESAITCVQSLRALLPGKSSSLVIERCPPEWKAHLDVWGPPNSDHVLMKSLKQSLDPGHLFNPGRFVVTN